MLEALIRWLGEALVRLYYPVRVVDGRERIPDGKPLIFVLNHPNGLLDPIVLQVAAGRRSRFLAKSSLFANPIGRLAMTAFGSIPVYRAHEGDTGRNEATFALCRAELAGGGVLALFPEGTSHSDPQMRPLKTGAARIALSAEAEHDGRLGVTLVPVGLSYERKTLFRSSVLLVVGEPIAVAPRLPDYRHDERPTVDALTDEIAARLDDIVLQAESRDLLVGIARVARWTSGPESGEDPEDPAARNRRAREMVAAYGRLRAHDPARLEAIVDEARSYGHALRRLGVRDPWALELSTVRAGAVAGAIGRLLLAAPLAAVGALLGWVPYRLSGVVAKRVTDDEDVLSTVKLIAGALFLFLGWTAEAVAVGLWRRSALGGALVFGAGLACGYIALRFEELARGAREGWRAISLRALHFQTARRLSERRRALADEVARALADQ